ncbi:MAG: gamma-glutamylcyclotransferase [Litoreibacter sp.]|nr:gamma-glutamylcyclotransferase [Litoreibacter sp.]
MGVAPLPVFLFGTLRDLDLLEIVAGGSLDWCDADLLDHRVAVANGQSFPILTEQPGSATRGLLINPQPEHLARLDFYESPYSYTRQPVSVHVGDETIDAETYRPEVELWEPGEDWLLERWQRDHGPLMREAALEIMDDMGRVAPELIAQRFGVIRTRAQQRLNARAVFSPVELREAHSRNDVELVAKRMPYSHFFTLQELDVRARKFTGEMSEPMERAVFVAADAVTVLPYDPVRDHVLLIEQFRPGCYLRGDPCPWSLEAVAGRQDPGETHE